MRLPIRTYLDWDSAFGTEHFVPSSQRIVAFWFGDCAFDVSKILQRTYRYSCELPDHRVGRIAFRLQAIMELLSDIAEYIKRVLGSSYRFGRQADLATKNGRVLPIGTIH